MRDHQHHFATPLPYRLGTGNQCADANRSEKPEGGQVDNHAFFGRRDQFIEFRGYRIGTRRVETP